MSALGTPSRDASGAVINGVLLLHGTAGSAADLAQPAFFNTLYGAGEPLDLNRYFLVIPDAIGAGDSSKPSDGLQARFPHYSYNDQVRAQHLLLERIGIKHLKLVLGTSMEETYDANDSLYDFESSADYDPAPKLNAIIKPMLNVNFADDLTNPPELLRLPTATNYFAVMFPAGPDSYGHMTLAHPAVRASALQSFLQHPPHERGGAASIRPFQGQHPSRQHGVNPLGLGAAVEMCGVDRVVFGSDYGPIPCGIKDPYADSRGRASEPS
jgi:homoserine acetyltransferase